MEMGFLANPQSICGLRKTDATGEGRRRLMRLFDLNKVRIIHV